MSDICAALIIIGILSLPILLIILIVRAVRKKSVKVMVITMSIVAGSILPLTLLGAFTDPATWCEHEYQVIKETHPTCTERGETTKKCSLCKNEQVEYMDALGHNMIETSRIEATYSEDGEIVRHCDRCDYKETEVLTKLELPSNTSPSDDDYIVNGTEIEGALDEIPQDNIVEKLKSFGFTDIEAQNIREIFLKCGLTNIDDVEATDPNSTIDGLVMYRAKKDKDRTVWFTIDNRSLLYIGLNGVDVYDADKGGYLININDVHIPESEVSVDVFNTLQSISETTLDYYFFDALWYDAWGVARSDNNYMTQCEVYANNRLGVKDWVRAKVWFEYDGENYNVTGVVIDGVRYK